MATGVGSFSISSSGNNINYSITWEGFSCGGTRQVIFRIVDFNRNAIVVSETRSTSSTAGSLSGTFVNVYTGVFYCVASFVCDGNRLSAFQTSNLVHGSSISPPSPGGEAPPVTGNPDGNPDFCIPTTGAVSMGDLNIIFGRTRNLASTLLSGPNNPSTSPSQFGISFLPGNTASPGKLRPNAISEFRGYCHVAPIVNPTLNWALITNVNGFGVLDISYTNTSGSATSFSESNTSNQSKSGSFLVRAGNMVTITVGNNSLDPFSTPLTVIEDGVTIYNQGNIGQTGNIFSFVARSGSVYEVTGRANSN